MKYLYVNQKPVAGPWGGGNAFILALHKHAPKFGWTVTDDVSAIKPGVPVLCTNLTGDAGGLSLTFLAGLRVQSLKNYGKDVPIILRCNENDARKATNHVDSAWLSSFSLCSKVLFVSNWLQSYFKCYGSQYGVLVNGVDTEIFKRVDRVRSVRPSVVAHHWSDNELKGYDVYKQLDELARKKLIDFTYIGRIKGSLFFSKMIPPLSGAKLGEALANHDVYISGSRFDPGPNHILEALACGLPVYVHRDGGGGVEFAGEDHAFSSQDEMISMIMNPQQNQIKLFSWEDCVKNLIKEVEALQC